MKFKISIFPEANPHPKGRDEKKAESFKVSKPYLPETVEINNHEDLIKYVTNYAWSPFVFSGYRSSDNFVSCDFLVFDVDDSLTIEEAEKIVEKSNVACLCLPSPSHSPDHHKFRLVLPLSGTITNQEVYEATWLKGAELFKVVDEQCKDTARYFFGCTMNDGFWTEGLLFDPVQPEIEFATEGISMSQSGALMLNVTEDIKDIVTKIYGEPRTKVPEVVDFFIRNAHTGLKGMWMNSLNSFCFSLALSGVPDHVILQACKELAPYKLDKKDLYQIKRSTKDGSSERDAAETSSKLSTIEEDF